MAQSVSTFLQLVVAKNEAFITLKDHKPAFNDHPTCRPINPSKSEIGVVSKHVLDEINSAIISGTQINQWKNTASVLKWFNSLENKEKLSFICFDVCEFYPSINEKLLSKALTSLVSTDPSVDMSVTSSNTQNARCCLAAILHGRKNLQMISSVDVTMGSFDGAETCELVGCYLLSLLTDKYGQSISLYRDDGLAAFNKTPKEIEKIKKELCKIFRENDLKITIDANKTIFNFLDVTLDLQSGKHYPYTKVGNVPLYMHKKSNHPPTIYPEKHPRFHQQTAFRNIIRPTLL